MQRFDVVKTFLVGLFLGLHLTLKMEAIYFSETPANLSRTIQRHKKEVSRAVTSSLKAKQADRGSM
jgi:hypothetical protein